MEFSYCTTQALDQAARVFRLIPAGTFRAMDGRPKDIPGWIMNATVARNIIADLTARVTDLVIDFEHQSVLTGTNGQPAPAAGWFKKLEWREGDGLYVIDARWTEKAKKMIADKEYRFISPVFTYQKTGEIKQVFSAGLTNTPALDGLTDLATATRQSSIESELSDEDRAKLQHMFGQDCFAKVAEQQANALRNAEVPAGFNVHEHDKMQAIFGADYAIRSGLV